MIAPAYRRVSFPVRVLLLLMVGFAALPPLVFALVVLLHYSNSQRERAENGLIESAKGVARAIDAEFTTAAAILNVLRNSTLLEPDTLTAFAGQLERTTIETGRGFALIDPARGPVFSTVQSPRLALSHSGLSKAVMALKDNDIYVSDVGRDAGTQEAFAFVAVPIYRAHALKWIMATFFYSGDFASVIEEPGVPEDWIVSIVDSTGTHIRRSHLNERFAGKPLVPVLIQHMAAGGTGTLRTTSHEGIPLISTVAYAPKSGWAAAIGLPVAKLEAPLMSSLRTLSAIGFVMAAAALTLALFVGRVLDWNLHQLRDASRMLDRGRIVAEQPSSIREVEDVFTAMAQVSLNLANRTRALDELTNSLEMQVNERTAELVAEMGRRQESEAQLRQLQRIEAIGKLTGGIAHDFNNMLAVIISSLELLQRHLERGDGDVQRFIDSASHGADSAARLTQRLLAFSRQQALRPESVDCNKLIAGMSEILRRTIPEDIEIDTIFDSGLWRTYIDIAGLENAMVNLVVNARDAMPQGGKLTIETNNTHLDESYSAEHLEVTAGQYVMVAVTDTGVGISADILDNVFEPFVTTKRTGQGTGLGLSQVHGFIKQSGGHIKIYSERGEGTTVRLYLPRLMKNIDAPGVQPWRAATIPRARDGELVLVAEDDAGVRQGTVGMLEELGYATLEAGSGEEALDILDSNPQVALLITDVVMPGMNGRQLADEAVKRRPDLRVLFSTGYTRNAIVHHGTLDPDVEVLAKPYTLETLARKVAELLGSQTD